MLHKAKNAEKRKIEILLSIKNHHKSGHPDIAKDCKDDKTHIISHLSSK